MNSILSISKRLQAEKAPSGGGRHLPAGGILTYEHVSKLKKDLEEAYGYWKDVKSINGVLLEVVQDRIVSKTNRIHALFKGAMSGNESRIVGAKYVKNADDETVHSFVYFLPSIQYLEKAIEGMSSLETFLFPLKSLDQAKLEKETNSRIPEGFERKGDFVDLVVDSFYIASIAVPDNRIEGDGPYIVTLYRTDTPSEKILEKAGIKRIESKKLADNTYLLTDSELAIIRQKTPFLVSMSVNDLRKIELPSSSEKGIEHDRSLPSPSDEPTIGVLDGPIQKGTYLDEWIESRSFLDESIFPISLDERSHATEVSSLIIDGPGLNSWLEDNCGHFRVRHCAVFREGLCSTSEVIKNIRMAVLSNPDIKVWNLSWGTDSEVSENFISVLGEALDDLQKEKDVIFVVAGTNKNNGEEGVKRVGEPADSFSSLVVNAVNRKKEPASYTRVGPVLSYIVKPDVAYYGGDKDERLFVQGCGEEAILQHGTSYAAPLMARKVAFLIHKMGLSKEEAKALIINSAEGGKDISPSIGFGVVPIKIEDIAATKSSEIRFIISGHAKTYTTSTHTLPIPSVTDPADGKEGFPFFVKATLCYFASGNRDEGVDYGGVEMSFRFGRVREDGKIEPTRSKTNYEEYATEEKARYLGKWNMVKMISEIPNDRKIMRKKYIEKNYWGFSLTTINRRTTPNYDIPFAIVVTLTEMNGRNRMPDFKDQLEANGWHVNEINIDQYLNMYEESLEELEFD